VSFLFASAQKDIPTTDHFSIEGKVKNPSEFSVKNTADYKSISIDSITIYNHLAERRGVIKNVKGILLKEVLEKAVFDSESPKTLSEFYIECIATDDYKVVFSWNELFNTEIGNKVIIITEKDGQRGSQIRDGMALISASDKATGRRFVKGLRKIVVKRL
jgi:hypothetical protein